MMVSAQGKDLPNCVHCPEYEALDAGEKEQVIMGKLRSTAWPTPLKPEWVKTCDSFRFAHQEVDFNVIFDRFSDERPKQLKRFFHEHGSAAAVRWVSTGGHPFTGLFKGAEHGLIRFSPGAAVMANPAIVQAMGGFPMSFALKLFRDQDTSGNIVVCEEKTLFPGRKNSMNLFERVQATITDLPRDLDLVFGRHESVAGMTSTADVAAVDEKGGKEEAPKAPAAIWFRPNQTVAELIGEGEIDFRNYMVKIPSDRHLFEAVTTVDKDTGEPSLCYCMDGVPCSDGDLNTTLFAERCPQVKVLKIGDTYSTSEFVNSEWGDHKLFFKHTRVCPKKRRMCWTPAADPEAQFSQAMHLDQTCFSTNDTTLAAPTPECPEEAVAVEGGEEEGCFADDAAEFQEKVNHCPYAKSLLKSIQGNDDEETDFVAMMCAPGDSGPAPGQCEDTIGETVACKQFEQCECTEDLLARSPCDAQAFGNLKMSSICAKTCGACTAAARTAAAPSCVPKQGEKLAFVVGDKTYGASGPDQCVEMCVMAAGLQWIMGVEEGSCAGAGFPNMVERKEVQPAGSPMKIPVAIMTKGGQGFGRPSGRAERNYEPTACRPTEADDYDFIVVGAGTAGSVVARRLSDAGHHVLLMDQGRDFSDTEHVYNNDMFANNMWSPRCEHHYSDEPAMQSPMGSRKIYACVAKMLGGASATNYGGWYRPPRFDFDQWATLVDDEEWSYDKLLPFFKKTERFDGPEGHPNHGYEGVVPVHYEKVSAVHAYSGLLKGIEEHLGVPLGDMDNNDADQSGIGSLQVSQVKDGVWRAGMAPVKQLRAGNSYNAWIRDKVDVNSKMPETLEVLEGAKAVRLVNVVPSDDGPVSVEYVKDGHRYSVAARKEVVLSAGTWGNAHLALLSGIGPKEEVESVGVTSVLDLPGVGRHFLDHGVLWLTTMLQNVKDPNAGCGDSIADSAACQFGNLCSCEELMAIAACGTSTELGGFEVKTNDYCRMSCGVCTPGEAGTAPPDPGVSLDVLRHTDSPLPTGMSEANTINAFFKSSDEVPHADIEFMAGMSPAGVDNQAILLSRIYQNRNCAGEDADPKSGGYMKLRSKDPFDDMETSRGWYQTEESMRPMLNALKKVIKLMQALPADPVLIAPSPFTTDLKDDEALKKYILEKVTSEMHLMGTMKMGRKSDKMAVVDSSLQLIGSTKVRAADTSIFPTGVRGHPMATAMAVGEKAADLILRKHGEKSGGTEESTSGHAGQCSFAVPTAEDSGTKDEECPQCPISQTQVNREDSDEASSAQAARLGRAFSTAIAAVLGLGMIRRSSESEDGSRPGTGVS